MMDLATFGAVLTIGAVIIGALWRVGSVGKTFGAQVEKLVGAVARVSEQVAALDARVSEVERRERARLEEELATLRSEARATTGRKAGLL